MEKLIGKWIKITLARNGFNYRGEVLDEDSDWILIFDEHDRKNRLVAKASLETIEVQT